MGTKQSNVPKFQKVISLEKTKLSYSVEESSTGCELNNERDDYKT